MLRMLFCMNGYGISNREGYSKIITVTLSKSGKKIARSVKQKSQLGV